MNAAEILTAVREAGAALRVEGGSLVASNASRLPPEIKTAIRENKPQIITALSVSAEVANFHASPGWSLPEGLSASPTEATGPDPG